MKNTEKAMLVVDMPIDCMHCYLSIPAKEKHTGQFCLKCVKEPTLMITKEEAEVKPYWCPLKPVPIPQVHYCTDNEFQRGAKTGYNACITEILKEEKEKSANEKGF
ncbi:MAG: hypothetical protein J6A75_13500 [Lachnospiraceae bacterium]|nr:hypothetical protein [Lachnospiraceae bacterium]